MQSKGKDRMFVWFLENLPKIDTAGSVRVDSSSNFPVSLKLTVYVSNQGRQQSSERVRRSGQVIEILGERVDEVLIM